jgi:hypothetical protein
MLSFIVIFLLQPTTAGPLAYASAQAACATLVVACYAAAGFTFGTVTAGIGTAPAILACNAAFGQCQAAIAFLLLLPCP